jgi:hypothetical protein
MINEQNVTFDLELPEVKDSPKPYLPDLSLNEAASWVEKIITMFPQNIPTPEERLRTKIDVPFEIKD